MLANISWIVTSLIFFSCGSDSKSAGIGSGFALSGESLQGTVNNSVWVGLAGNARLRTRSGKSRVVVEAIPYKPVDPCEPFPYPSEFYEFSVSLPNMKTGKYVFDCSSSQGDLYVSYSHYKESSGSAVSRGVNGCGSVIILEITDTFVTGSVSLRGGWPGTNIEGPFKFPICDDK